MTITVVIVCRVAKKQLTTTASDCRQNHFRFAQSKLMITSRSVKDKEASQGTLR